MFNKPSKAKVLARFAARLGPQRSAAHLLSHLGDRDVFLPFTPGEEPHVYEVLAWLLRFNPHITVDDVVRELNETRGESNG